MIKGDNRGNPALTKWFYGFNSRLVLGPGHTKDVKNGSGSCFHGTYDEVGTTNHNWSDPCQYNMTGWRGVWACDILSQ